MTIIREKRHRRQVVLAETLYPTPNEAAAVLTDREWIRFTNADLEEMDRDDLRAELALARLAALLGPEENAWLSQRIARLERRQAEVGRG